MMKGVYYDASNALWLNSGFFEGIGVSNSAFRMALNRSPHVSQVIDGESFVSYASLPGSLKRSAPPADQIRKAYLSDLDKERRRSIESSVREAYEGPAFGGFYNAISKAFPALSTDRAAHCARLSSVVAFILGEQEAGRIAYGALDAYYKEFSGLFPGKCGNISVFRKMLSNAKKKGVIETATDARVNNRRPEKYGAAYKYLAEFILSHNKAFSLPMAYDKFSEACKIEEYETPCYRWFQSYYGTNRTYIEQNRMGASRYDQEAGYRARIIPAQYIGDQWQIDGWELPVYGVGVDEKGHKQYYCRYILIAVMDACARKIVGFSVWDTERTEGILAALENAVTNTGYLPYEIVMDNHSFNRTKAAAGLKERMEKLGVHWTVDSNPRRKAILERSFRTLGDGFFKDCYGYIGQGIKSRVSNGITQQELRDIYTKPENMLTGEQITLMACSVVKAYNEAVRPSLGTSPNERFEAIERPNAVALDAFGALALFHEAKTYTVRKGQLVISERLNKYIYQLSASVSGLYEGKKVAVRWSDRGEIYAYDPETDKGLFSVKQLPALHGALANQTDEDKELLYKNAGRVKGREAAARRRKESLFDDAVSINPNIYETANRVTMPKDILKKAEQDYMLREMYEQQVSQNPYMFAGALPGPFPKVSEMLDSSLKPRRKEEKHPFSGHTQIRVIEKR